MPYMTEDGLPASIVFGAFPYRCPHCGQPIPDVFYQDFRNTSLVLGECVNPDCEYEGSSVTVGRRLTTASERQAYDDALATLRRQGQD